MCVNSHRTAPSSSETNTTQRLISRTPTWRSIGLFFLLIYCCENIYFYFCFQVVCTVKRLSYLCYLINKIGFHPSRCPVFVDEKSNSCHITCNLQPETSALQHAASDMRQASCSRRQATCSMRQAPCSMLRAACSLRHATSNLQQATSSLQPETCDKRPAACDLQQATSDLQHATNDMQHATCSMHRVTC